MKKVTTSIDKDCVIINIDGPAESCCFSLPYSLVHPATAVKIAGILASDPYVRPVPENNEAN